MYNSLGVELYNRLGSMSPYMTLDYHDDIWFNICMCGSMCQWHKRSVLRYNAYYCYAYDTIYMAP